MGSVLIIVALVVVVVGVPTLLSRRPWKREGRSVNSHGATMATLAALAERSKDGVPAPASPLPDHGNPRAPTAPATVRQVPAAENAVGGVPAEIASRPAALSMPPLPVIETRPRTNDAGILWIGPVSEPLPPEEELVNAPPLPSAPPLRSAAPIALPPDLPARPSGPPPEPPFELAAPPGAPPTASGDPAATLLGGPAPSGLTSRPGPAPGLSSPSPPALGWSPELPQNRPGFRRPGPRQPGTRQPGVTGRRRADRPSQPGTRPPRQAARPPRPASRPPRPDVLRGRPIAHAARMPAGRRRLQTRAGASAAVALLALAVAGAATALALSDGLSPARKQPASPPASTPARAVGPAKTPAPTGPSLSPTTVVPLSSSAGGATYGSPSSSFTLVVAASGPCWVEVKPSESSTQTTFEGVLNAGTTQTFSASGSIWLRVGYASHITVTLNGTPVQVPAVGPSPFNLTFAPTPA